MVFLVRVCLVQCGSLRPLLRLPPGLATLEAHYGHNCQDQAEHYEQDGPIHGSQGLHLPQCRRDPYTSHIGRGLELNRTALQRHRRPRPRSCKVAEAFGSVCRTTDRHRSKLHRGWCCRGCARGCAAHAGIARIACIRMLVVDAHGFLEQDHLHRLQLITSTAARAVSVPIVIAGPQVVAAACHPQTAQKRTPHARLTEVRYRKHVVHLRLTG
mmetsp:Transcript_102845/g.331818  ORF Transcript_102845/g.331818 Transcript_102845/m.331818 type:complete len:213 (-) Transcript_102845:23-661(-)